MKARIILGLLSLLINVSILTNFASLALPGSYKPSFQEQLLQEIQGGDLGKVQELLKARASIHDANDSGSTPLHYATLFSHLDIARFLIKTGAIVNTHNKKRDGNTPLHEAVEEENEDIVNLLLKE